jgi:pimeloyl-ACP methyl ester carboxylesterase
VLVLKAERDPILTMNRARWLVQTLPNARLEVVEKAGHYAQEDQPEKVAAAISGFLKEGT